MDKRHESLQDSNAAIDSKLLGQVTAGTGGSEDWRKEFCPFAKIELPCADCIYNREGGGCGIEEQWGGK